MKALFVGNHPYRLVLEEILYHGLMEKFGKDSIVDYPYIPHFHGKEPPPHPWYSNVEFPMDEVKYSREDALAMKDTFDLAIIGSLRKENNMVEVSTDVLSWGLQCPIIFADGEDCPYGPMVQPTYSDPRIKLYFTRQYMESFHGKLEKCRPITSAVYGEPPVSEEDLQRERPIDVMMSMGMTESFRNSILQVLKTLPYKTYLNTEGPPYANSPVDPYRRKLLSSKIALSPTGDSYSYDQHQYYRIPYFGAVLLASRRPTVIVDNFVDWESAVFFNEAKEVPSLINQLLSDEVRLSRIAQRGRQHLLEHHTSVKRVEYILDCLKA